MEENIIKYYPIYYITFKLDQGLSFAEDYTIKYQVKTFGQPDTFKIKLPKETKRVKVELVNSHCIVDELKVWEVSENKRTELQYSEGNLDALEGGQYYFFSEKPELCYEISESESPREFWFSIKYVTFSKREINMLYETMIKVKEQYERQL